VSKPTAPQRRVRSDAPFYVGLLILSSTYILLIAAMLIADGAYTSGKHFREALASPEIQYAIKLSLISCSLTALLSLWVAVPVGYLMARHKFPGKALLDAMLDIPIVLPPLVIGLSLLILFQTPAVKAIEGGLNAAVEWVAWVVFKREVHLRFTYAIPGVILAQFMVACAFAVRTMRATFDHTSPRAEEVARTLGCNRSQAFWMVALPEARRGVLTAATLAWARSLGEFGPILIFAGATRMRTEVLPTTVFLELTVGNIEAAVAVSLIMVLAAVFVLLVIRTLGRESLFMEGMPK